jgi:3-hydroxyisobutyrate dehydrogenase
MIGSSSVDMFEETKKVVQLMGKNIVDCQGLGNGQVAKICNNLILGLR